MKLSDDFPIGTRFIVEVVPAPKTQRCCGCCFEDWWECDDPICCGIDREDGKDVIFKLVSVHKN